MGCISIHALCEEGDTLTPKTIYNKKSISIHALCEEGDLLCSLWLTARSNFYPRPLRGGRHRSDMAQAATIQFLSTPSARRATDLVWQLYHRTEISIHALCEEGDLISLSIVMAAEIFLSTPSARRAT